MARIRSVKPELYRHVELFKAEQETGLPLRLAFIGLFSCADREGRFKWQPWQLKLDVLPYDAIDFETVLGALKHYSFIMQYTVGEKSYGAIPSWVHHQRPSRDEPSSVIPPPEGEMLLYNQPPTQTLRLRIYERDQYCCVYCKEDLRHKARSICLDYVIPLQQEGTHRESNVATSCKKCAARKINRDPLEAGLPWPTGLGEKRGAVATSSAIQESLATLPTGVEETISIEGRNYTEDILTVFHSWKQIFGHAQAILDDKRKTWIRQALSSGYSVDQLIQAIRGCSLTPHNMGKNEQGQRYDGLHVILKDADQIDRFIQNAVHPPQPTIHRLTESNIAAGQNWLRMKKAKESVYDSE